MKKRRREYKAEKCFVKSNPDKLVANILLIEQLTTKISKTMSNLCQVDNHPVSAAVPQLGSAEEESQDDGDDRLEPGHHLLQPSGSHLQV